MSQNHLTLDSELLFKFMMKYIRKLFLLITISLICSVNSLADNSYFIDFTKVLNSSKPGAEAQIKLQKKLKTTSEKFRKLEEDVRKQESEIISQKKVISADEYKKKVENLRSKVTTLQKDKQNAFSKIAVSRKNAKKALLKALNPIIKKYMEDNNIRVVLDKKTVILADSTLEITDKIIAILNKEFPSIKVN